MDKEKQAIERLRFGAEMSQRYYDKPLIICDSGGKDSTVLTALAIRSGIKFEMLHSHTTADAPETVYYIRKKFHTLECDGIKCDIEYPIYKGKRTTMWDLIPQKGIPPTRIIRYCCSICKETGGANRAIATGVRWAESKARADGRGIYEDINRNKEKKIILNNDNDDKRRLFERCEMQAKVVVNPIVDWTNDEIWGYIDSEKLDCNICYSYGFNRVGCVGCPIAGKKRYAEFRRWPAYETMYKSAFRKMLERKKALGIETKWQSEEDVFRWWMEEDYTQLRIEDVLGVDYE